MGLLVIREPGREDRVYRIRRERVTIGRDESADLILPDVSVSRRHACLVRHGGECELQDLGSTNGVKVNGEATKTRWLEHGDLLRIGCYRLEYHDERKVDLLQVTRLASLGSSQPENQHDKMNTLFLTPEERDALTQEEQACERAILVREDGEGGQWKPGAKRITIGPGGDVPIDVLLTSQPVAEIRWDGEQHLLRAWGWAHRVEVNGVRIRESALEPGATIRVGDATFRFVHES